MGYPSGTTSIKDSTSSITINSSVNGDGTHAGFIGTAGTNTVSMTNCVFDGSIVSASGVVTDSCGGFVGWKGGTVSITNCLMAANMSTIGDASNTDYPNCTFVRPNSNVTITNSYYTVPLGVVQGKFIGQLTLPEGVTASAAEGDTVTYDKKTWYIGGKTVTLTVTPPEGYALAENGLTYTYTAPDAEQSTTTALNAVWNESDGVYTATYTMPASDVTVTATFTRTVFSVFFDNDDGNMTEQNVSIGGKITKPDDPVSPYGPGYTFGGWYAVKDGVNYEYEGGWYLIFEHGDESDTYLISAILNTWELTDENDTVHSGDEYLRLWDFDTDTVTKDMCLFARWKRVYSVSVANNIKNGTVQADKDQATKGETVTLTVSPGNGYALGTLTVDQQDVTASISNGVYAFQMPDHAVTVTATFTRTVFSVFFDNDDGNMTEQNVSLGGKVTKPEDPESPGYIFGGWYVVKDGVNYECENEGGWYLIFENGEGSYTYPISSILYTWEFIDENNNTHSGDEYLRLWDFDTDTVTKDMCLFARWKQVYSVSVANNIENGTVLADKDQAAKGETVILTVTPANGYALGALTVDQQDVTADVSNGMYAFQMPDHAVSVTATFTRVYYTITLHCPSLCATMTATMNRQPVDLPAFVNDEATIQAGEGDTVALTVIPNDAYWVDSFDIFDDNYEFLDVTFSDGENGSKTATFAMPARAVRAYVNIQSNAIRSEAFYDGETVLFAVTPSKNPAKAGETITLTVTKDKTVTLDVLTLRYWDKVQNEEITQNLVPDANGDYSFTMPDTSVEILSKIRLTGRKYTIDRTGLSDAVGVKVICGRNEYNIGSIEATSANAGDTVEVFANGVTLTGFAVTGADGETVETVYKNDWYEPYYSFTMPAQNVMVTGTAAYAIRLPYETTGGSLSIKVNGTEQQPDDNNTVAAQAGDSIIVTATPNVGYRLINLSYSGMSQGGDVIKSAEGEGEGTPITSGEAFTMPANNINIFARFDTPWRMLQNEINNAQEGKTITLTEDIIATADDGALSIASWMPAITIDLNGHTINRHLTAAVERGFVIDVDGTLTLMDSAGSGTITGGYNSYAGGGIFVSGTLNLQGGAITGNRTNNCGGGVYMSSRNSVFNFTGGTITGNTANGTGRNSNGVMYGDGAINVSGNPIAEDAVWIESTNETIHVTGALAQTAQIAVAMWDSRVFTTGWSEKMGSADPADYFTSADPAYMVRRNASGEAELGSAAEAFGTPDFILPYGIGTIEANAFEGMKKMTVVDARNCTKIGAEAFKGTGLKQIKLPYNCEIHTDAFKNLEIVYVFAPAGGKTETFCNTHDNVELVSNGMTILESTTTGEGTTYQFPTGTPISDVGNLLP